jgi:glycosyltransferase involved in cell wall biosynthesis
VNDSGLEIYMLTNAVAPDKLGGLERYVRELSAALVLHGARVTVLAKQTNSEQPVMETGDDGVRVLRHRVPAKSNPLFAMQYPFAIWKGIRPHIRDSPNAIVHGHYLLTTLPAAWRRRGYVYTFHAPLYKEILAERAGTYVLPRITQTTAVAGVKLAERSVVSKASPGVVLSEFMRAEMASLSERAGRSAQLVPGGVDTDWFTPGHVERDDWAATAHPLLFTARRLTARTGVRQLVDAMPAVLRVYPAAKLAIAGTGALGEQIQNRVRMLGLTSAVRLLGNVEDGVLRSWYRASDLSVVPTQDLEGFGLSTAESLACGTPVLVSPAGANPELVAGLHPLLVAEGSGPTELAKAICLLLGQPRILEEVASRARLHAHPRCAWSTVASAYLEIYASFLRGQMPGVT